LKRLVRNSLTIYHLRLKNTFQFATTSLSRTLERAKPLASKETHAPRMLTVWEFAKDLRHLKLLKEPAALKGRIRFSALSYLSR
jgi:hypothetical protein